MAINGIAPDAHVQDLVPSAGGGGFDAALNRVAVGRPSIEDDIGRPDMADGRQGDQDFSTVNGGGNGGSGGSEPNDGPDPGSSADEAESVSERQDYNGLLGNSLLGELVDSMITAGSIVGGGLIGSEIAGPSFGGPIGSYYGGLIGDAADKSNDAPDPGSSADDVQDIRGQQSENRE